jgi:hypothetical protein
VDEAMLRELQRSYISLDETRERILAKIESDLGTARDLREQAERDQQRVCAERDRVERDYLAGELGAANFERLSERLADEYSAAVAKVERLRAQEHALAESQPLADAEGKALKILADLRTAVVDGVSQDANLDAIRRLLHRLFEEVVYRPRNAGHPIMRLREYEESVIPTADAYLEPHLRPTVIEDYDEQARPVLKRLPMPLGTDTDGLPT